MKKILLALLVLTVAVPAMGAVTITMRKGATDSNVIVGYSWTGTGDSAEVRAFALNVGVSVGAYVVGSAKRISNDYYVTPTNITFKVVGPNTVIDKYGSPAVLETVNGCTIEVASLYAAGDPCLAHRSAPPSSGDLVKFLIDCTKKSLDPQNKVEVTMPSVNTERGGVVLKDGNSVTPTLPAKLWLCMTPCPPCVGCPTRTFGDATDKYGGRPDGKVNSFDLAALRNAYGSAAATYPHGKDLGQFNCCTDSTDKNGGAPDGKVNSFDLSRLRTYYGTTVGTACTFTPPNSCP